MTEITRNIDTVTAEIIVIRDNVKRVFYNGVIEIGRRLEEAKQLVPQGEWLKYLDTALGYKPSTAQNYMRIAREFGGGQIALDGKDAQELFGQLSYTQLLPLLGIGEEERRELAEDNDLSGMSSREIDKLVADYKAAQNAVTAANNRAEELAELCEKSKKARDKAEEAEENERNAREAAEKKVKALEGRIDKMMKDAEKTPIEGEAQVMPSEEEVEKLRSQIRAEQIEEVQKATLRAEEAERKLEAAKNPALVQCQFLFAELQNQSNRLTDAIEKLCESDPERGFKIQEIVLKWYAGKGETK